MVLLYIEKIVRDRRGSPIDDVSLFEQCRKLRKRCYMSVREADKPV